MTTAEKRQLILATANSPAYILGMVEKEISRKRPINISKINRSEMKPISLEELIAQEEESNAK